MGSMDPVSMLKKLASTVASIVKLGQAPESSRDNCQTLVKRLKMLQPLLRDLEISSIARTESAFAVLEGLEDALQKAKTLIEECHQPRSRVYMIVKCTVIQRAFEEVTESIDRCVLSIPMLCTLFSTRIKKQVSDLSQELQSARYSSDASARKLSGEVELLALELRQGLQQDPEALARVAQQLQLYTLDAVLQEENGLQLVKEEARERHDRSEEESLAQIMALLMAMGNEVARPPKPPPPPPEDLPAVDKPTILTATSKLPKPVMVVVTTPENPGWAKLSSRTATSPKESAGLVRADSSGSLSVPAPLVRAVSKRSTRPAPRQQSSAVSAAAPIVSPPAPPPVPPVQPSEPAEVRQEEEVPRSLPPAKEACPQISLPSFCPPHGSMDVSSPAAISSAAPPTSVNTPHSSWANCAQTAGDVDEPNGPSTTASPSSSSSDYNGASNPLGHPLSPTSVLPQSAPRLPRKAQPSPSLLAAQPVLEKQQAAKAQPSDRKNKGKVDANDSAAATTAPAQPAPARQLPQPQTGAATLSGPPRKSASWTLGGLDSIGAGPSSKAFLHTSGGSFSSPTNSQESNTQSSSTNVAERGGSSFQASSSSSQLRPVITIHRQLSVESSSSAGSMSPRSSTSRGRQAVGMEKGRDGVDDEGVANSYSSSPKGDTEVVDMLQAQQLVAELQSGNVELQVDAAQTVRHLAKSIGENRARLGVAGSVPALIRLLGLGDSVLVESALSALLNLSIYDRNKREMVQWGIIDMAVQYLQERDASSRPTAACELCAALLFSLSVLDENKSAIGKAGGIDSLLAILLKASPRGKQDTLHALYNLSLLPDNRRLLVAAAAPLPLVNILQTESNPVLLDRAAAILAGLATREDGRMAIESARGIPALAALVDVGSPKGKEDAAAALLLMSTHSPHQRQLMLEEDVLTSLMMLTQCGTPRAKSKARALLKQFNKA